MGLWTQNPTAFTSMVAFLKKLDWVPFCSVTNSKSKHTPRTMTGFARSLASRSFPDAVSNRCRPYSQPEIPGKSSEKPPCRVNSHLLVSLALLCKCSTQVFQKSRQQDSSRRVSLLPSRDIVWNAEKIRPWISNLGSNLTSYLLVPVLRFPTCIGVVGILESCETYLFWSLGTSS